MFAGIVRRLWRRPWSLALAGGLVVLLLGAAFFVAGPGGSGLFGLTVGGCEIKAKTQCPNKLLVRAYLVRANLGGANLTGANLYDAELVWANLTDANLTDANLRQAQMWMANLTGANLTGANLIYADLRLVNLTNAKFCNTTMPDGNKRNDGC